jgi:hypothetical protein
MRLLAQGRRFPGGILRGPRGILLLLCIVVGGGGVIFLRHVESITSVRLVSTTSEGVSVGFTDFDPMPNFGLRLSRWQIDSSLASRGRKAFRFELGLEALLFAIISIALVGLIARAWQFVEAWVIWFLGAWPCLALLVKCVVDVVLFVYSCDIHISDLWIDVSRVLLRISLVCYGASYVLAAAGAFVGLVRSVRSRWI